MNIISTQHNYTFKLTSALTKISLPYAIKNSSNLKIIFLKYTVATVGQESQIYYALKCPSVRTNFSIF